jgi:hypothetical protein
MKRGLNDLETIKLSRSLLQLKHAFMDILEAWELLEYSDIESDILTELYPFDASFDELTSDVIDWVDDAREKLKSNIEE